MSRPEKAENKNQNPGCRRKGNCRWWQSQAKKGGNASGCRAGWRQRNSRKSINADGALTIPNIKAGKAGDEECTIGAGVTILADFQGRTVMAIVAGGRTAGQYPERSANHLIWHLYE